MNEIKKSIAKEVALSSLGTAIFPRASAVSVGVLPSMRSKLDQNNVYLTLINWG